MAKQEKNRTGSPLENGDGRNMDDITESYRDSQEDSFDTSFNSTEKDYRGSTEYEKHR